MLLAFLITSCITPPPPIVEDPTVPLRVRIVPRNPTTRERTLTRNCRWYLEPYTYERGGWFEQGQSLITQESEENSYMYRIYEIDDYGTGFMYKSCFNIRRE